MKKLAAIVLLSLPLVLGSCKKDKYTSMVDVVFNDHFNSPKHIIKDLDNDKLVDVIINTETYKIEFYAPGYDTLRNVPPNSIMMTKEIRYTASNVLRYYNEYYHPKKKLENMNASEKKEWSNSGYEFYRDEGLLSEETRLSQLKRK